MRAAWAGLKEEMCRQMCPSQEHQSRMHWAGGTLPTGHLVASQLVNVNSGLLLSKYCAESSGSVSAVKETAKQNSLSQSHHFFSEMFFHPCGIKQSIIVGMHIEAEGSKPR